MADYLWWEENATVPVGRVRADMTVSYAQLSVAHVVSVNGDEPDMYTACHRLVPTDAALRPWPDSAIPCRVCRRKVREARWG